ncbi:MAG: hypothetical protein KF789_00850 [Bdellovibrionaceae bacterium]|nr:hypothetical protein [Pseudobdellovibrionaceae bacterium]
MEKAKDMGRKIHIRRCHQCGGVCESVGQLVTECSHCGKHLAPFYYYNERLAMSLITREEADMEYRSSALPLKEYPALWGLTAYWDG